MYVFKFLLWSFATTLRFELNWSSRFEVRCIHDYDNQILPKQLIEKPRTLAGVDCGVNRHDTIASTISTQKS